RDHQEVEDAEEYWPHHVRERHPERHPCPLHGGQPRRDQQPSGRADQCNRPEYASRQRMAAPGEQGSEHRKARRQREAELPALHHRQPSPAGCHPTSCVTHQSRRLCTCHLPASACGSSLFSITNGGITSASSPVLMKQECASAGVHTMGSPRTLNEVFTSTGHPVSASNAESTSCSPGARSACTVCSRAE